MRLDNVIYRIGLAKTRRAARQMVAHGHITVNGKKMRVPSYHVHLGDTLAVREGSRNHMSFEGFADRFSERPLASWLVWSPSDMTGGVKQLPTAASADPAGDLSAVLSFYTR
jgi:small subunit ribosomal protein S4